MSPVQVSYQEEGYHHEDGTTPETMLKVLESTLRPLLEEEKQRLTRELDFLKKVHSGITRGAPLEFSSTIFVDGFLSNLTNKLNEKGG